MPLILRGAVRRAAAEQALLNYFPLDEDLTLTVSLSAGRVWTTAAAKLERGGTVTRAAVRARTGTGQEDYCVKESIYRAARPQRPEAPAWGSLTGIRPAKLTAKFLRTGGDAERILDKRYHVAAPRRALAIACAKQALDEEQRLAERDIALYVGIPFCPTRCAYCSFVSADVERSHALIEPFAELLCHEIALSGAAARALALRPVSLYIGGGTPTTLSSNQLDRILGALETAFDLTACTERTVEAGRPDTITADKLAALRRHGVNRVSVNPQSMREPVLRAIGRAHDAAAVEDAFELVRGAGFETVNADLIAGLPGDDPAGFAYSLERLLGCGPENLTVHTLALKKGARLFEQAAPLPTAEQVSAMLDHAAVTLRAAGYEPYYLYRQKFMSGGFENIGWTRPGHICRYNLHMMEELVTILAMGGGGVTKVVHPERAGQPGSIKRLNNCKFPLEYLDSRDKIQDRLAQFAQWVSPADTPNREDDHHGVKL